MSQEKLKRELLEQVSKDVSTSPNPQKEALQLVKDANETYKKFESAIKKPLDEELLKARTHKKNVQFAEPIHQQPLVQKQKSKEERHEQLVEKQKELKVKQDRVISEKDRQQQQQQQQQQKKIEKSNGHTNGNGHNQKQSFSTPQSNRSTAQKENKAQKTTQQAKESAQKDSKQKSNQNESEQSDVSSDKQSDRQSQQQQQSEVRSSVSSKRKSPLRDRELQQQYTELIQQQHQTQKQMNEFNLEKNKILLDNQRLQSQYDIMSQEHKALTTQLNQAKKQIDDYEKQLFELKQTSRIEILQIKDQLQESKFLQMDYENKSSYLNKIKQTLESNIAVLETENQKLTKQNQYLSQNQHKDKLVLMDKDGTIERLTKQLSTLESDYNQVSKQYKETQDAYQKLQNQFNKVDNERNHLQNELDFRKNDSQSYLDSLKDKIQKLQQEKHNHDKELEKLQNQVKTNKEERDHYKLQFDQMKVMVSECEELRKRLKLREVELEQLQNENDKLKWKIRKDPNGMLSDLKIMSLNIDGEKSENPYFLIQKQENQIKQLTEENTKINAENCQLIKQVQQTELYLAEVKQMFDRERVFLEDKLHGKDKELNDLVMKHRHDIIEQDHKYEELKKKFDVQQRYHQTDKSSPYNVPQLQSRIRPYS